MAYTAVGMPTSPATMEQNGLRRSHSSKDLCTRSIMRRSYSDNHLCCCSINRIQATSVQPKIKGSNRSMGISPFQFSGSILPNSLRSLFDQQTSKDMNNIEENMVGSGKEERVNRSNWVERLMEIKKHWRNRLPKESLDMDDDDAMCNNDDMIGECDCDDDNGCVVDYDDEEEDGQGVTYDRDSFSKFLAQVSWSDTKLYSQLAFLCNIAYVIPQIKVIKHSRLLSFMFLVFHFFSCLNQKRDINM